MDGSRALVPVPCLAQRQSPRHGWLVLSFGAAKAPSAKIFFWAQAPSAKALVDRRDAWCEAQFGPKTNRHKLRDKTKKEKISKRAETKIENKKRRLNAEFAFPNDVPALPSPFYCGIAISLLRDEDLVQTNPMKSLCLSMINCLENLFRCGVVYAGERWFRCKLARQK